MRFSWLVLGLLWVQIGVVVAQDADNLTNVFVNFVTADELGLDGLASEKLVVSKLGDPVKAYSFSTQEDIQKGLESLKEEALKQRLSLVKEGLSKNQWVSLPISQLVEIYEVGTIYANINKKAYRSRVRLTVTSPDNYKSIKLVQVYPEGEDISAADFMFSPDDQPVVFKTRDPVL
ncbi:MAG TPA: hypothetical protein VJG90_04875, partial [Candidatus Nanoarchaeia archaeon]|nr:hypothetical protein [Candidatus Nanoarchaeia archaeon]